VKFQTNFHVSAAILDWWAKLKQKFLRYFVRNLYADRVTEVFPQISIGYDAAAKNRPGGNFTPWTTGGLKDKSELVHVNLNIIKLSVLASVR
jgi:hypothetical protein